MRLFELEQMYGGLPKKAGVAKLDWATGRGPSRNGEVIILPVESNNEVQFFPLLDGKQFLVQFYSGSNSSVHFGGTDEQPFLVELNPRIITSLRGGEDSFFDELKPEGVKLLEDAFETQAIRQGDWFAVPLPFSWKAVCGMVAFFTYMPEIEKPKNGKQLKIELQNTRHTLFAESVIRLDAENRLECALFGEGLLTAPDHRDRELKGPHAFFQTSYLVHPEQAD